MSPVLMRAKPISNVTRIRSPGFMRLPWAASSLITQTRMISSGPREDGDLGGPGGSEATPGRVGQNRRLALMTGGAVLATVAAYSVMTGRTEQVAPAPARNVDDVVIKK